MVFQPYLVFYVRFFNLQYENRNLYLKYFSTSYGKINLVFIVAWSLKYFIWSTRFDPHLAKHNP